MKALGLGPGSTLKDGLRFEGRGGDGTQHLKETDLARGAADLRSSA
jgi:hypothetical protein